MKKLLKKVMVVVFSGAVGFVNGFFGGGGGMLLVPLLEKAMKCPVKKSHATAIAIILPISIASAITYIINGYFDWTSVLSVSGGCVAGAVRSCRSRRRRPSCAITPHRRRKRAPPKPSMKPRSRSCLRTRRTRIDTGEATLKVSAKVRGV